MQQATDASPSAWGLVLMDKIEMTMSAGPSRDEIDDVLDATKGEGLDALKALRGSTEPLALT